MGSFGGGLETIGYEFDPRSILQGVARVNHDFEEMEKTGGKVADNLKRDWGGIVDLLTRVSDRSKNASDSYIRSLERQASAAGKTGLDKLNAQMEQAIKNYGYSESAINKITAAYDKMAKAQSAAGGGAEGGGVNTRFLIFGAKDLLEGRSKNAAAEAVNVLQGLKGAPLILGGIAAGFAAVSVAAYESASSLAEYGRNMKEVELRTGFSASHAVVGIKLGLYARSVTIVPDLEVKIGKTHSGGNAVLANAPQLREVEEVAPRAERREAESDLRKAARYSLLLASRATWREGLENARCIRGQAESMVAQWWLPISSVACELLQKRTLEYRQINRILAGGMGSWGLRNSNAPETSVCSAVGQLGPQSRPRPGA
jgi:hypothetical protein